MKHKPLLKILALYLVIAIPFAALLFLHYIALGLGYDLDGIHNVLLGISFASLPAGLVATLWQKRRLMAWCLGIGILSLAGSFTWEPFREAREKERRLEFTYHVRLDKIQKAFSLAECNDGSRAILTFDEAAGSSSKQRLTLNIMPADLKHDAVLLNISTTGKEAPDYAQYDRFRKKHPELACSNSEHKNLDAMYQKVVAHYRQQHPLWFPEDPLYSSSANQSTVIRTSKIKSAYQPVNPYDLNKKIYRVNEANRAKRARLADLVIEHKEKSVDKNGNIKTWRKTKIATDHPRIMLDLWLSGNEQQSIKAWNEEIMHAGRTALRYTYTSVRNHRGKTMAHHYDYIIDHQTGITLYFKKLENDLVTNWIERSIVPAAESSQF